MRICYQLAATKCDELTSQNSPLRSHVNDVLTTFIRRELGKNLPTDSIS